MRMSQAFEDKVRVHSLYTMEGLSKVYNMHKQKSVKQEVTMNLEETNQKTASYMEQIEMNKEQFEDN